LPGKLCQEAIVVEKCRRPSSFINEVDRSAKIICDYAVPLGHKVQEKLKQLAEAGAAVTPERQT
jgi:hypothetical protein